LNFKYFDIQIIWYDYIIDENFCKGILQGRNGNFFQIKIPDKALIGVKAISGIGWL
jgi:hypothetical protein